VLPAAGRVDDVADGLALGDLVTGVRVGVPQAGGRGLDGAESGEPDTEHEPMIALTRPELLRLLRAFVLPQPVTDAQHVLHWPHWRRRHQHRAATCHRYWNEITAAA
jgi:hypothetical protein